MPPARKPTAGVFQAGAGSGNMAGIELSNLPGGTLSPSPKTNLRRRFRLAGIPLALAALLGLAPGGARATGNDFLDETFTPRGLLRGEMGLELGTELRHDNFERWQAWFQPALEAAPTSRLTLEGALMYVNRGKGLEFGGWKGESRYRLTPEDGSPVQAALGLEFEVETRAAKHAATEKSLRPQLALSAEPIPGLTVVADLGAAHLFENLPIKSRTVFIYAAGLRYPERGEFMVGIEVRHDPLEKETRVAPQVWLELPGEWKLRAGMVVGARSRPYRNIARLIAEKEF